MEKLWREERRWFPEALCGPRAKGNSRRKVALAAARDARNDLCGATQYGAAERKARPHDRGVHDPGFRPSPPRAPGTHRVRTEYAPSTHRVGAGKVPHTGGDVTGPPALRVPRLYGCASPARLEVWLPRLFLRPAPHPGPRKEAPHPAQAASPRCMRTAA
jgi:hypothetical protein